jgi:hypothetical protein
MQGQPNIVAENFIKLRVFSAMQRRWQQTAEERRITPPTSSASSMHSQQPSSGGAGAFSKPGTPSLAGEQVAVRTALQVTTTAWSVLQLPNLCMHSHS